MSRNKTGRKLNWLRLVIVVVAALCVWRLYGRIDRYMNLRQEVASCQSQLDIVQAEYDEKVETIELLSNDSYIERLARENLGMVCQGETPVSAVKTAAAPSTVEPGALDGTENDGTATVPNAPLGTAPAADDPPQE